jgi:hypothetical protein
VNNALGLWTESSLVGAYSRRRAHPPGLEPSCRHYFLTGANMCNQFCSICLLLGMPELLFEVCALLVTISYAVRSTDHWRTPCTSRSSSGKVGGAIADTGRITDISARLSNMLCGWSCAVQGEMPAPDDVRREPGGHAATPVARRQLCQQPPSVLAYLPELDPASCMRITPATDERRVHVARPRAQAH